MRQCEDLKSMIRELLSVGNESILRKDRKAYRWNAEVVKVQAER